MKKAAVQCALCKLNATRQREIPSAAQTTSIREGDNSWNEKRFKICKFVPWYVRLVQGLYTRAL